jgi:hypothetical protein
MSALFTQAEIDDLGDAGNIARAWFLRMQAVGGGPDILLHNGCGKFTYQGETWNGVEDPIGGRIVSISGVEEPQFGQASSVSIVMSGADIEFVRYMRVIRNSLEGLQCDIYWALFDDNEKILLGGMKRLYPRGRISTPSFSLAGIATRQVSLTIENIWSGMNFPSGRRWNATDQQQLYPGDKGFDYAGVKVIETQK